jgi:ATP-dependent Clp protease adaptor protein ClpS
MVVSAAPAEVEVPRSADNPVSDKPWVTIVWNDPVNLMSYVTYVFQTYFGYATAKAERLMRDVHEKGRAVVSAGTVILNPLPIPVIETPAVSDPDATGVPLLHVNVRGSFV